MGGIHKGSPTKMKKLKIPKAKLKAYWLAVECVEDVYWKQIQLIEKYISKDTGVKDIELFHGDDGSICGIGNTSRTIKLIHR